MKAQELKNKKITMATLKSFIRKSESLFVLQESAFNGMTDMVEYFDKPVLTPVSKENAIGHHGVYCVGDSRDYLKFYETDTHYGIEVWNCCGSGILLTAK